MKRAAIVVVSNKDDYAAVTDGTDFGTEIRPTTEGMHAALTEAVMALRNTARDLRAFGDTKASDRFLDHARLIEEAIK